jgi:membrane protein implicated in regulation of membrane protease activity
MLGARIFFACLGGLTLTIPLTGLAWLLGWPLTWEHLTATIVAFSAITYILLPKV